MLTQRYLTSTKNLAAILAKIQEGVAPDAFTVAHLKNIGFASSGDRAIIPLMKDLGLLGPEGRPSARYHAFRDRSQSKAVLGEALREAYSDVFHVNEHPTSADRPAIEGLFKSKHNSTDKVAQLQAMTFFALLGQADLKAKKPIPHIVPTVVPTEVPTDSEPSRPLLSTELHYTIQVHLPATKDIEVFNAIFRSLRENLLT